MTVRTDGEPTVSTPKPRSAPWRIFVCDRCGSPEGLRAWGLAIVCMDCSRHWTREEAPTVEVVPAGVKA